MRSSTTKEHSLTIRSMDRMASKERNLETTLVILHTTRNRAKEKWFSTTNLFIMVNGTVTIRMGMEHTFTKMAKSTKDNGKMVSKVGLVFWNILMRDSTMASSRIIWNMVLECSCLLTAKSRFQIGSRTSSMASANWLTDMVIKEMDSGKMAEDLNGSAHQN